MKCKKQLREENSKGKKVEYCESVCKMLSSHWYGSIREMHSRVFIVLLLLLIFVHTKINTRLSTPYRSCCVVAYPEGESERGRKRVCVTSYRNNSPTIVVLRYVLEICTRTSHTLSLTYAYRHIQALTATSDSACVYTTGCWVLLFFPFQHTQMGKTEKIVISLGVCVRCEWMEYDFVEGFLCFVLILLENSLFSTLLNEIEIRYSLWFCQVAIVCAARDSFIVHVSELECVCACVCFLLHWMEINRKHGWINGYNCVVLIRFP